MSDLKTLVEREMERAGSPGYSLGDLTDRRSHKSRNQRITAAAVAIAVIAVPAWFGGSIAWDGLRDRSATSASSGSADALVGLPPEGATPSVPEHGVLVAQFGETWVYADGRLISAVPHRSEEPPIGLVEQRLTTGGVEYLRSAIVSTGLFDHDLALGRSHDGHAIGVSVRNGGRLVHVVWAVGRPDAIVGEGAPLATPEQAQALKQLDASLSDPSSWPANVWQDPTAKAYVPSMYAVCVRGWPHEMDLAQAMDQLPEAAQSLLRSGEPSQDTMVAPNGDCSRITTDDARSLAQILDTSGIDRWDPVSWLQWRLEDPADPKNNVVLSFGAVMPDGQAVSLGLG